MILQALVFAIFGYIPGVPDAEQVTNITLLIVLVHWVSFCWPLWLALRPTLNNACRLRKENMMTTHFTQQELRRTVVVRIVAGVVAFCALFFLPAGTIYYWPAWLYMLAMFVPMSFFSVYLLRYNQPLLERRLKMREQETQQQWIVTLSSILFCALILIPGFDWRFGWSSVPNWLVIASNIMVLVGYLLVIYVLVKNEYAARTIEVEEAQQVITTGPYAIVRHPMYAAITVLIVFTGLALGSYWALIPAVLLPFLLVARILNEEEVLGRDLKGYAEYCESVRYRLIPGIG